MSVDDTVAANADGSFSLWFQTVPGKGWFSILRLYGPLDPWFDKTWQPGETESV